MVLVDCTPLHHDAVLVLVLATTQHVSLSLRKFYRGTDGCRFLIRMAVLGMSVSKIALVWVLFWRVRFEDTYLIPFDSCLSTSDDHSDWIRKQILVLIFWLYCINYGQMES